MTVATLAIENASPRERSTRGVGGVLTLGYGLFAYAAFLAAIVYAIGFVGNWMVPKSIDTGPAGPMGLALLVNTALLAGFVLQHTIMARPAFKRWWTRIVPKPAERSTFVLAASATLGLLYWQWRPLPSVVWNVSGLAGGALAVLSLAGWAIVFVASATISHLDLFGVRQAWLRFRNRPYTPVGFRLAGLYRLVRHPLMVGFLIASWATPRMTAGHLFFALMITAYILFGVWMEERDLIAEHGADYLEYKRRVPGFIPLRRKSA